MCFSRQGKCILENVGKGEEGFPQEVLKTAANWLHLSGLASLDMRRVLRANKELEKAAAKVGQARLRLGYTSEDPFYKPAAASSASLEPIQLGELHLQRCHQGRVLTGVLQGRAFKFGNLAVAALQDEAGKAARLMLRNVVEWRTPEHAVRARYPEGARVVLKEPCLVKAALGIKGTTLWVPNPASFEVVSRFPDLTSDVASELKELGDREFWDNNLEACVELYTRCIELCSDAAALSSRAEAYLRLGCFSKALKDATQALELSPGSAKDCLIKAQASMALRRYAAAAHAYERALELAGAQDKGLLQLAYRESRRFDEQSRHGKFDIASAAFRRSQEKFPDFVGPVRVEMTSDGKGRGLFTTARVAAGELLLVHNSLVAAEAGDEPSDFLCRAIAACLACPRIMAQVSSMYRLDTVPSMQVFRPNCDDDVDNVEMVDVEFDASGVEWMVARSTSCNQVEGLWTLPRFVNHSCLPNISVGRANEARYVHAAKDLEAGSELLTSYFSNPVDLLRPWNPYRRGCECNLPDCSICNSPDAFVCKCSRCALERRLEKQLEDLCTSFQALVDSSSLSSPSSSSASTRLAQLAIEVEKRLEQLEVNEQEKQWIRTSFAEAYSHYYSGTLESKAMPPLETFLESLYATAPGDNETLRMMVACSSSALHDFDSAKVRRQMQQACSLRYGKSGADMYGSSHLQVAAAASLVLGILWALTSHWGAS